MEIDYADAMYSLIPSALKRQRNGRGLTLSDVSAQCGMSVQHLSEIESSKRDPRLSSIERVAEAMQLSVMLVPEHLVAELNRYIATNGRAFSTHSSSTGPSNGNA